MTQPIDARRLLQSAVDRTKTVRDAMRAESERIAEEREKDRPQGTPGEVPQ